MVMGVRQWPTLTDDAIDAVAVRAAMLGEGMGARPVTTAGEVRESYDMMRGMFLLVGMLPVRGGADWMMALDDLALQGIEMANGARNRWLDLQ